ncbi:SLC13 family permease [Bacillus pinisoli]|uniref:SLC13 family permease n=1 Tax=Bacillus pinisoli TaxID=2901866 RepID=UPI001FF57BE5|nr:DASS family sodium-coupled anion symporter [Bacillus pinisoli]
MQNKELSTPDREALTLNKTTVCLFLGINALAWLLIFYIPIQHAKTLILLIFALSGWGLKVIPQPIVSLLLLVYIPFLNLGSFTDSLIGFSQPFIWLLVATFLLAASVEKSGFGKRLALWLLSRAKGRGPLSILYIFFTVIVLGFTIPTAAGRSSMIMPVSIGMIQIKQDPNFAKSLMLGVAFTSSFISWGLITGSSSSIYAVSFLESSLGYKWTYFNWFLLNFPPMILTLFCLWLMLRLFFPLPNYEKIESIQFIQQELIELGKMKVQEWKVCAIGLLTIIGWCTESVHGYSVSMIALLAGIITCLPGIGIQSWKEGSKHIAWDVVILFGSGYALAQVIIANKTSDWIAEQVLHVFPSVTPFQATCIILGIIIIIRAGFANMLAITAVFLPIAISLSEMWNLNPIWTSQIVIIACSFSYFLPIQSPSNLICFSYGYFSELDLLKTGSVLSVINLLIVIVISLYYWPLLGLTP